jgi:hypothetical protein
VLALWLGMPGQAATCGKCGSCTQEQQVMQCFMAGTSRHTTQRDCLSPCCCALSVCIYAQVLSMLVDVQLSSISSRQLGRQAPHQLWGQTTQELSAMPRVEVTLQQVCCATCLSVLIGWAVCLSGCSRAAVLCMKHRVGPSRGMLTSAGLNIEETAGGHARSQWHCRFSVFGRSRRGCGR